MADPLREPLIDTDALQRLLETGDPVTLLDVRWSLGGPPGHEAYAAGHVPGAVFVNLETDLADPPGDGRGRHPLPETSRFESVMRAHGVRTGVPVVVYDGADGTAAARAWWLLSYHGHPDVRLLDGGWQAWTRAGGEASTQSPTPEPGDFVAQPGHLPLVDADSTARIGREGLLLDARAAERYRGEVEPIDPVAGHIPGAVSAPTFDNVNNDGRWHSAEALADRFAALGVAPGHEVAVYCGSGVTAAHEVLALRRVGVDAALYPGSWSEWISDPRRPVATGDEAS